MKTNILTKEQIIIKNLIESLAYKKFNEFSLSDWTFDWGKGLSSYGQCFHDKKIIRLSLPLAVSDYENAKDTLYHEIAHALVGSGHGHDNEWKSMCEKLGGTPKRLGPNITLASNFKENEAKYSRTCPVCNWSMKAFRKNNRQSSCPKCSDKYDERFELIWKTLSTKN